MKRAKNIEYQNEMARDYATRFIAEQYVSRGYYLHYHRNLEDDGTVLALVTEGEVSGVLKAGKEGIVVLDKTPFYAEMGGQTADHGTITCGTGVFRVTDVQKDKGGKFLHQGVMESGYEAYETCSRCDYTTYKEIAKTGHQYVETVFAPTCTVKGYTTHTCSVCGDNYIDSYVDALGHDRIHHDGMAPTCTESGFEAYDTCSHCDTLSAAGDLALAAIEIPRTCYSRAIVAKGGNEDKISTGIARLLEEDKTLAYENNAETKQMTISGLGDIN